MELSNPLLAQAAGCLAAALEDDPFYSTITPNQPHRRATLAAYFDYSLREGQRLGITTIPDDPFGAAIWTLPQERALIAQASADKLAYMERTLGPQGFQNYCRMLDFMTPHAEPVVDSAAWYLSILGVCPDVQGKGLGAELVAPVLALADQQAVTCYLETFTARTLGFYRRIGFEIAASHPEPVTGQTYWIMVRPSR